MLTASAAQPRNGTAPNAPAASTPPVLRRNLRRLSLVRRVPFGLRGSDSWRIFVMPLPPVCNPVRLLAVRPIACCWEDASGLGCRLQYAAQHDPRGTILRLLLRASARGASRLCEDHRPI